MENNRIGEEIKIESTGEILTVIKFDDSINKWILEDSNKKQYEIITLPKLPSYKSHIKVGEKFKTTYGGICEIIEYYNNTNSTVRFINDKTIVRNVHYKSLKNGNVVNPNLPTVYNIGYFGFGKYSKKYHTKFYSLWNEMLRRCYSELSLSKFTTYKDCYVCNKWLNFQVFAEWCEKNYIDGFHLDKDILINGNKIYSPDTCCFVPVQINSLLVEKQKQKKNNLPTGVKNNKNKFSVFIYKFGNEEYLGTYNTKEEAFEVYKRHKETYIKEVADIWKNKIKPEVYQALYNYEVGFKNILD